MKVKAKELEVGMVIVQNFLEQTVTWKSKPYKSGMKWWVDVLVESALGKERRSFRTTDIVFIKTITV